MFDGGAGAAGARAPGWTLPGRQPPASFRDYVERRRYDFGRGRADSWAFIARMRGDADFPDIRSWTELRRHLEAAKVEPELVRAAQSVWRSFTAYRSVRRRGSAA